MKKDQWQQNLKFFGPVILLVIAAFSIAFYFIKPGPPSTITIATGDINGAYHAFAKQYQKLLAKDGISLTLKPSNGSIENLQLLESKEADIAFVQGGTGDSENKSLISLASLYYEPLWLFVRQDINISRLSEVNSQSTFIGNQGSGTRALVSQLLKSNGLDENLFNTQKFTQQTASLALKKGQLEAAFFVSSANSPLIKDLLHTKNIRLVSFSRAEAYSRHFQYLSHLKLPEGGMDLAQNIPSQDIQLLATTANLVAHNDLHSSLIGLLLQAAEEVHSSSSAFEKFAEFPSDQHLIFQQPKASKLFFKYGPPFLQRFMPFWAASLIDRIKVMLLPLIILLLPLFKFMPSIYRWRMHARIYRWYDKLELIDIAVGKEPASELLARLEHIEDDVQKVRVPLSFADRLYHLREHIDLVRSRIQQETT